MSPKQFFDAVDAEGTQNINVWNGELYLELHNGTYTTMAKVNNTVHYKEKPKWNSIDIFYFIF